MRVALSDLFKARWTDEVSERLRETGKQIHGEWLEYGRCENPPCPRN
jgi:hypothetical protein